MNSKLKTGFLAVHCSTMKWLAVAALVIGLAAGVQAVAHGASLKEGAGVALSLMSVMAVGVAPGVHSAVMGLTDKRAYLKELKYKASLLQPATAAKVIATLGEMEENLKPEVAAENEEKMNDLVRRARTDASARAEMAQMRIITVDNFILATTNPIAFFDTIELADNEVPVIENTTNRSQEILVNYLGQDGRARRTQGIKYQSHAQIDLRTLSTEEFEYTLTDIYKGDVKNAALANVDLARDLEVQISKLMWPFIKSQIGAFNLAGSRTGRVYFPHSQVNIKNLPTTNLLEPDGNTSTTLWRKECMDVVLRYAAAWGNIFPDGQMKPVAVYIPSSEVMGYLDQITLTSQPNSRVEEIFDTGFVLNYGGARWNFIADATLDPDEGLAYVKFNKAIGTFFRKPGMDKTFEDESIAMQKQNKGSVSMSKVIGFGLPVPWRLNIAAVRYHDAR